MLWLWGKYEPGHAEHCTKRNKSQLNALIVNELDKEINEDLLNEMAIDELLTEDFCQLSLNGLAGTESGDSIRLKTTVQSKTMLILVDTGSSHNFVSSHFMQLTQLPTVPIKSQKVKLANGNWMTAKYKVKGLQWYIQGYTFTTDMIILDQLPYDAILGFDWLQTYSPVNCDWKAKTLQFQHQSHMVTLKGLQPSPPAVDTISAKKVFKSMKGNDIWAYVMVESLSDSTTQQCLQPQPHAEDIQDLVLQYAVFQEPKQLPPHRSYDHAIPLFPNVVPVNARPYHYSPQPRQRLRTRLNNCCKMVLSPTIIALLLLQSSW